MKIINTYIVCLISDNAHFDDEWLKLHETSNEKFFLERYNGKLQYVNEITAKKLIYE